MSEIEEIARIEWTPQKGDRGARSDYDLARDLICQQRINANFDRATFRNKIRVAIAGGVFTFFVLLWLVSNEVIR